MTESPRVTLGIATYNRDTYLAEAIDSGLSQDYESLEVLVVVDGSTNPGDRRRTRPLRIAAAAAGRSTTSATSASRPRTTPSSAPGAAS